MRAAVAISFAIRSTISGEILSVLPGSRSASPLSFSMALLKDRAESPIPLTVFLE